MEGKKQTREVEGIEMNCRALLRRLAFLQGDRKKRLKLSTSSWKEVFQRVMKKEGWQENKKGEVGVFFHPGECVSVSPPHEVKFLCVVGERLSQKIDGFTLVSRRPFKLYQSLNTVIAKIFRPLRLPSSIVKSGAYLWRLFLFDRSVGGRMAAFSLKGNEEFYFVREGESSRSRASSLWKDRLYACIVTFGGVGKIPLFPGSFASLVIFLLGMLLWGFLSSYSLFWWVFLIIAVVSTFLCIVTETWADEFYLTKDPREVVLDEVAGMAVAFLFVPEIIWRHFHTMGYAVLFAAFLLFRFFDIFKIGVRGVEKTQWRGSIVWDDVLAGAYAGVITVMVICEAFFFLMK